MNLISVRASERLFLAVGLALVLVTGGLWAQERSGRISGTVTDQSGAVIPGAKVTAESSIIPRPLEVTTDSSGRYQFLSLPVGTYTLTYSANGFQTVKQFGQEVSIGSDITYNAKLQVGQMTQTVEVVESSISIDPTSSRTATNISVNDIQNMAKTSRSFNSLLVMAPGVRMEIKNGSQGVGGVQVDGASGSENAFFLDGVEVSDIRRGTLRSANAIPLDFIADIEVKSGGFEAQYGGATGGVINVATKGGSNAVHGQLGLELTTNQLNAGDRGFWQRSPLNANAADFFRPKEDSYRIIYPVFSVGGPLIKNRVFFFQSYAPEFERSERTNSYAAGARNYFNEQVRNYSISRLDYAPTSKIQLNSSYIWSPQRSKGGLPSRDIRIAAPANNQAILGGYTPAQAFTAGGTYSVTSKLLLSAKYGYKYLNDKGGNYGLPGDPYVTYNTATSVCTGTAATCPAVPAAFQGTNGFRNVSSTLTTVKDVTTRHNVYLDGTYRATLFDQQHTFKVGYALNRLGNDVDRDYTNGQFTINWGEAFTRGSVTNQRGTYGYYRWEDGVRLKGQVSSRNQGLYFQDNWRIHPRVTLNLGVRFENEYLPPFIQEVKGVKVANPVSFGWADKVAPRIGGAWDILGDGKWKLSGSFGLFYDSLKYELARGSFGGDYWVTHVYRLDQPNYTALSKTTPGALGAEIINYDNRTVPINAQGELDGIDPDIKPYSMREFSATLDHQISSKLVASVRYTRKDLLKAIEDIGVLDADDSEVYLIGNPGFGETRNTKSVYGGKTPNGNFLVPEAIRQYDAVEFRLQGMIQRINLQASYTWSRLYGNYSGSANSDESGRSDPGVSRAFDLPYYYFDASGSQKNVLGRLGTDRPHTFKLFGFYDVKWFGGTTSLGLNQVAYSGTPDTTTVIYLSAPTSPFGRGDLGRTPVLTQTDINVGHTFALSERTKLRFDANIRNLFNQNTVIARVTQFNRSGALSAAQLPLAKFFAGYKLTDYVNPTNTGIAGTGVPYNPIYGLPSGNYRAGGGGGDSATAATYPNFGGYQDFRVIRLGARLTF